MRNFDWSSFTKRVYIKTDKQLVYDSWTQSKELEKWFLNKALFFSKDNKLIQQNTTDSIYNWTWYAQNHSEKGKILTANGTDIIEFSFAGNCVVKVKIKQENNYPLVELTQSEIPTDDTSKQNIRLGCTFGWAFYLLNLKSYREGGIDLRNKDIKIKNVINN